MYEFPDQNLAMLYPDARLIVFAKAPVEGRVKTRLIPHIGAQTATELYCLMVERIVRVATESDICPVELWCSPNYSHEFFQSLKNRYSLTLHTQVGDNLGQKMFNAANWISKRPRKTVIVGCDCPQLSTQHLESAFQILSDNHFDAVVTPAHDGGYVMIGMKENHYSLFSGINWGTAEVLNQTRKALEQLGWRWRELPSLHDLDVMQDMEDIVAVESQYPLDRDLKLRFEQLTRKA